MGWSSRGLQDPAHGLGVLAPDLGLAVELFLPGLGEPVELGAAVVLRDAPFGLDGPLVLEPVERRIERSLVDLEQIAGHLLDALGHAPPMLGPQAQSLQDQQIESALQKI